MRLRLAYGAIFALTVALVVPYTAAAAENQGSVDVAAARVAAEHQLISLGIDPGDAVFQVGARNYAGPDCPGSGWNCTSAATVVQIATRAALGSINKVEDCSDKVNNLNPCTITQMNDGGQNEARCVQRMSANTQTTAQLQRCTIIQTNTTGTNKAFVSQSIHQAQPQGPQDGQQRVTVSQANGTGENKSTVAQTIVQIEALALTGAGTITQSQEAHQRADVCQSGAISFSCSTPSNGKNVSNVAQSNIQRARVHFDEGSSGSITQLQNTDPASGTAFGAKPKSTAVVTQLSVADTNTSGLLQFNRQVARVHDGDDNDNENDEEISTPATTFAGPVIQKQGKAGNPVCPIGGLCGYVAQDSTGVERAFERQNELQKVQGPSGASQNLGGPEFCCATQTGGNAANVNDVDQVKVQLHTSSVVDGKIQGHCESSANGCKVKQTLRQNGTTQTNSCTGSTCNPTIVCQSGTIEGVPFTNCTPGTATGPLPAPCPSPSPRCSTDAPIKITMIAPLWFEARSANL